jgi:GWxTD domain-containing protein
MIARRRERAVRSWPRGAGACLALIVSAAITLLAQEPGAPGSAEVEATFVRSWAGDGITIVDGLASVPLAMLAGGTTRAYRFELTVTDTDGNVLLRDSWEREVSARAAEFVETDASSLLESFRFGLRPGTYDVEIHAYPTDAADLGVREASAIEAFDERPVASDLILSTRVEPLDSSGGGSWSLSRGGFGINAVARTVILSEEPTLFYYLELYGAESPESVDVEAAIVDPSSGRVLFGTPAESVDVPVGGNSFTGKLPLAGLPPGFYRMEMTIASASGQQVVRTAVFEFRESAPQIRQVSGGNSELAEYFSSLSDEELELTFGGVGLLVTDSERRTFESLPPDAKRRYLVDFFGGRDPSPGPGNAFLDEYLERIATITARYSERVGTGERRPWTTDMGRIYLLLGEPADRIVNYSPSDEGNPGGLVGAGSFGSEPPYEIWQYQNTGYVYLFIEENRFGAWRMIFTTDPNMTSLADWYRRIGTNCAQDLTSNYGIVPGG